MFQTYGMRLLFVVLVLTMQAAYAQQQSPYQKFGKITVPALQKQVYSIDSNASVVVLSDIGKTTIEGNSKFSFSVSSTRHRVVHILNKNGYDEATVEIFLYSNGEEEEKLESIRAVTYNLEGGKLVQSKVEKTDLFKVRLDRNLEVCKFTFPNVQEGSIIEYEYKVSSDFVTNLDAWYFQENIPVLWSEYNLSVPQFFTYTFLGYGYHRFSIKDRKNRTAHFTISDSRGVGTTQHYNVSAGVTDYRWAMKDIPALQEEQFTSSIKNHIARIEFQLASQNYPLVPHDYRSSWSALGKELLSSPNFGEVLNGNNNWLASDMKIILAGTTSETEKAKKLFFFIRDHFMCTDYDAFQTEQSLGSTLKSKRGNVAELNLLLTVMLRYAGLKADPVILSTRDHGYIPEEYPVVTAFNYVLVQCIADSQTYYLDASHPRLGFGNLLPNCYNGHARLIKDSTAPVYFMPDSLVEKKLTVCFLTADERGSLGVVKQTSGFYESYMVRNEIAEKGKDWFFENLQKQYEGEVQIRQVTIDSLYNYEAPVSIKYELKFDPIKNDIAYMNPMFGEGWKKNPFISAKRLYPVEMPYAVDETYLLTMQLPQGYMVEELPKQMVLKLDDRESAVYEYRISESGSTVSLRSQLKINRTLFTNDEYENLRQFFNMLVAKQNERIILKKKN